MKISDSDFDLLCLPNALDTITITTTTTKLDRSRSARSTGCDQGKFRFIMFFDLFLKNTKEDFFWKGKAPKMPGGVGKANGSLVMHSESLPKGDSQKGAAQHHKMCGEIPNGKKKPNPGVVAVLN